MPAIRTVAVIGAGVMGRSIAHATALAGYRTILKDILPATLCKAEDEIRGTLLESVRTVCLSREQADAALARVESVPAGVPTEEPRREVPALPLMVQYVRAGRLGRKAGRGVFEYPEPAQKSAGAKS